MLNESKRIKIELNSILILRKFNNFEMWKISISTSQNYLKNSRINGESSTYTGIPYKGKCCSLTL